MRYLSVTFTNDFVTNQITVCDAEETMEPASSAALGC
jgi:hypothetical protein